MHSLLLFLLQALSFLGAAASSLPLIAALGLIIGRRGHASFCIAASRQLLNLALGLALLGFFYFPLSYLLVVLPYGLHESALQSLFSPEGRPWLMASLCWLLGLPFLVLGKKSLQGPLEGMRQEDKYAFRFIRSSFILCFLAALAFFAAMLLENWPFAGLPEGMSLERAALAILRHSLRRFFMSLCPAGALALACSLWLFASPPWSGFRAEKLATRRWLAFWAAAGTLPSLITSWGFQLAIWARSAAPLAGMENARLAVFGLLFQTLAAGLWIWIIFRPGRAAWRIGLGFFLLLLKEFWPLILRAF